MDRLPPPLLLNTFRVAVALKLVGVFVAIVTGYLLIEEWVAERWWLALTSSLLLLIWLLPWPRFWPGRPLLAHIQLLVAIIFTIAAVYLEVIQSSWFPYAPLPANALFVERVSWSYQQINNIHALGLLFLMIPVILASWQYSFRGMWFALGLAGFFYLLSPFLMPPDAFNWGIYAVRGFVLLGTTLILAFIVSTLATAQRREQAAVAQANTQLAEANRKLAQQTAVLEQLAISQERNRLARELHDTLAHSLSGTAVQLEAVSTLLKVDPEAAAAELTAAQQQIKSGLDESRRAIAALRATPLEELGLAEALRQRCYNFSERNGIPITCQIDEPLPNLPPFTEQTIYRIADEALLNAEKHAQASVMRVRLSYQFSVNGNQFVLEVWDNGVGFEVDNEKGNGRFGLIGMAERAELVGAELNIESDLGEGTCIRLLVIGQQ